MDMSVHGSAGDWGMGPGMMGWGHGTGWFGGIMMFVFWIALLAGLIVFIRWLWLSTSHKAAGGGGGGDPASGDPALTILRERYAKGEIDKEEYEAKLKILQ